MQTMTTATIPPQALLLQVLAPAVVYTEVMARTTDRSDTVTVKALTITEAAREYTFWIRLWGDWVIG